MSFSDSLRRLRDKAVAAITARSEPLHRVGTGTITDYAAGENGQVLSWTIQPDGADGDVPFVVPPRGMAGEGVGATVLMEGTGGATGTIWEIKRVTRPGVGTGGTFPGVPLATPLIDSVHTSIQILRPGALVVFAYITIYLIVAQWRHGQIVGYEAEVRATTGQKVAQASIKPFGSVWGRLDDALGSGVTTPFDLESGVGFPALFGASWGIISIEEDELVLYQGYKSDTRQFGGTITRGYDGSSDDSHADASFVRLRGLGIATSGSMLPNANYEARVWAVAADGRRGNPTDWFPFTTAYDTTAPTWSGSVGLAVVAIRGGFRLTWNPADTDADDLAYYEVRASPDNATWTTQQAGNGTGWTWAAKEGSVLYFQVRAADTSDPPNVSSWSGSVRSFSPHSTTETTSEALLEDLITNGTFPANVTGWTLEGVHSATLDYDATHGANAVGCAVIEESGVPFPTNPQLVPDDPIAVDEGYEYVMRLHVARNDDVLASDSVQLLMQFPGTNAEYSSPIVAGDDLPHIDDNEWMMFEVVGVAPKGATEAKIVLSTTLTRDDPLASAIYVDDIRMFARPATKGKAVEAGADFDRLQIGGGGKLTKVIRHSQLWNPDPIDADGYFGEEIAVTGAALGDVAIASFDAMAGERHTISATVIDEDVVYVELINRRVGTVDLDEGNLVILVIQSEA